MSLRVLVFMHYKQQISDKIDVFRDMIAALSYDASNDAKSSAGDKHETALSMMHLEQEKLNRKLADFLDQKNILDKIDISVQTTKVVVGSLVQANELLVFIATALPKITINQQNIFAISPQSPLGQALLGNKKGYQFELNNKKYTVLDIIQ